MSSKVVFLHNYVGNISSGVNKKILSQVVAMKRAGIDVHLAVYCESTPKFDECCSALGRHCPGEVGGSVPTSSYRSMRDVLGLLRSLEPSDFLYLRYPPIPRITIPLLMARKGPRIIFEVNGILSKEGGNEAAVSRVWRSFEKWFGKLLLRRGAGIVGVTDEIIRYYGRERKGHVTRSVVISNGISVDNIPVRTYKGQGDGIINLLGVAFVSNWHGFDRIIKGMGRSAGDPDVIFHIVGEGPEINTLKALTSQMGLEEKVRFHGFLTGERLDALFDSCDIAVGTLALHRKGLAEACTLKAREYCTRGIPFVDAGTDPDFPGDWEYILRLALDDSEVSMTAIHEFVKRVRRAPTHPEAMNQFARDHLDWTIKEQELKAFLDTFSAPPDAMPMERSDRSGAPQM